MYIRYSPTLQHTKKNFWRYLPYTSALVEHAVTRPIYFWTVNCEMHCWFCVTQQSPDQKSSQRGMGFNHKNRNSDKLIPSLQNFVTTYVGSNRSTDLGDSQLDLFHKQFWRIPLRSVYRTVPQRQQATPG